jgi:hypothetical protein
VAVRDYFHILSTRDFKENNVYVVLQLLKGRVLLLWALIAQLILSDNLTDLIWGVIRIHKLDLCAFVPVTLVGMYDTCPHKEDLFINVDNVSKD